MTFELRQNEVSDRIARNLLPKLAALRIQVPIVLRWWQRRETEQALQWLSDRDLADIGVARHEIRELARSQAQTDARSAKGRTM